MRYLAIDLGEKRTGLAAGDSETRIVSPLTVLDVSMSVANGQLLLEGIAREVEAHLGPARAAGTAGARLDSPGELVIGLPLNMDGTDSPRTQSTRAFARNLLPLGLPILLWDERWSTAAVERAMIAADVSRAKRAERIDSAAAAFILQGAIDAMTRG